MTTTQLTTGRRGGATLAGRGRLRSAFTLIELLLVLVILGVLAAVVVPKFTGRTEDAKIKGAKASITGFKTALTAFEVDNGRFPTTEEGLRALIEPPPGLPDWKQGGYVDKNTSFNDPWGNPFVYKLIGPGEFQIISYGPDGREGNDDITN